MSVVTIHLPDEVEEYADDIRRFVDAMVYKLKVHSSKGHWDNYTINQALDKLDGEVAELREAVDGGNMVEMVLEAADVANYAMIASSIAMIKGK